MTTEKNTTVNRPRLDEHGLYVDDKGRTDIEVRVGDTAFGSIMRKPRGSKHIYVTVNGRSKIVQDPHGYAHVFVDSFPRDMDTYGYG